jgi:hypothetical protein
LRPFYMGYSVFLGLNEGWYGFQIL